MQAQCKQCWEADVATAADDFDGNDDANDNADKGNDLYVDVHLGNDYYVDLHLGNGSYVDVQLGNDSYVDMHVSRRWTERASSTQATLGPQSSPGPTWPLEASPICRRWPFWIS